MTTAGERYILRKITLSETRILFQHRTRMTKNAGNFKNWEKYDKMQILPTMVALI